MTIRDFATSWGYAFAPGGGAFASPLTPIRKGGVRQTSGKCHAGNQKGNRQDAEASDQEPMPRRERDRSRSEVHAVLFARAST